jgi:tyrosine-protein kinase Etk/Wzc
MGQIQTLDELLGFLLRRKVLIGLITAVGVLISLFLAKAAPDVYESVAVVQVESAQIEDGSNSVSGSAALMQSIEQRLTTRENMIAVIERHGLYTDLTGLTIDQKVGVLRSSVGFQSVASVGNQTFGAPASISAIIISARTATAEQAARVANDFAQGILDMSAMGSNQRAIDTFEFFKAESTRVEGEITALENQIAGFKNDNAGAMPALVDVQRNELTSLDTDLRELSQQLLGLTGERDQLEKQGNLRATAKRRLDDLNSQIEVIGGQVAALETRKAEIETALSATPDVERELAGYDRQLQQLQDQFAVITRKLAEAETSLRLAETQQSERFSLLERAITPEYPLGSGGKKLAVAGALGSLILGVGVAFLLELLRPVVRTSVQMERQLGLRPVIAIPELRLSAKGKVAAAPLPNLREQIQSLPKFVVVAGGLTLLAMAASLVA